MISRAKLPDRDRVVVELAFFSGVLALGDPAELNFGLLTAVSGVQMP
jgi:hypothetical protein